MRPHIWTWLGEMHLTQRGGVGTGWLYASLGCVLRGEDECLFIVSEIIMFGGVICWNVYIRVMWAAKRWNEVNRILKPFFFPVSYNNCQVHPFLGNNVCPTACGLVGLILCLLSHLPLLSVAREVSGWSLTYHITYVNNNHGPLDGNKNSFSGV